MNFGLDEKEKPLESANIITKPLAEKATLKFAIAVNKSCINFTKVNQKNIYKFKFFKS